MADTVRTLRAKFIDRISLVGDTPALDVRLICMHVLGWNQTRYIMDEDKPLDEAQTDATTAALERRAQGEPVAYITGERSFYQDVFSVRPGVLVPRADTEVLVEAAVEHIRTNCAGRRITILDVCSGTGCIGISVAKAALEYVPSVTLHLSDLDDIPVELSQANADRILASLPVEVEVHQGDLLSTVEGLEFDLVLSNPPYIRTSVIPTLDATVRREPMLALDGGEDGLDLVRRIVDDARNVLVPGGLLAMEVGYDQTEEGSVLMKDRGYVEISVLRDLGGNCRVVKGLFR